MSGSALKPAAELSPRREQLPAEEIELCRHIERVAKLRRALPPGSAATKNYAFEGEGGKATMPDLFGNTSRRL